VPASSSFVLLGPNRATLIRRSWDNWPLQWAPDDWYAQNLYKKHTNNPTWLVIGTETVRDCSNDQPTNQTAISACFQRSRRVKAPITGPCKGCRERFRISKRHRANCVERVSRHSGNIVSKIDL
jgi:hypothetical protein